MVNTSAHTSAVIFIPKLYHSHPSGLEECVDLLPEHHIEDISGDKLSVLITDVMVK